MSGQGVGPQPLTTRYTICGYRDVLNILQRDPHDLVISIEHPGAIAAHGLSPDVAAHGHAARQHKFIFWDNDVEEAEDMCTLQIVTDMLELMRDYRGKAILIHCRSGKSRSTAAALIGIADEMGPGYEAVAVSHLNAIRNICTPNPLVIRLGDDLLQRDGRLKAAVDAHPGIRARMPEWQLAKIRSLETFYSQMDPEKAMPFLNQLSPERRAELLREAKLTRLKLLNK